MAKPKDSDKDAIDKDDEEIDRIARGGRGGENVSEMLGAWRDDVQTTKDPRDP
jgi:hypothetical protein